MACSQSIKEFQHLASSMDYGSACICLHAFRVNVLSYLKYIAIHVNIIIRPGQVDSQFIVRDI